MKRVMIWALALCGAVMGMRAEEPANGLDLNMDENKKAIPTETAPDWFVEMDYCGFDFKIPAGCYVDRGADKLLVRYPDGSFGLSMETVERPGSNQDTALKVCEQLAASLNIPASRVKRVDFGKCHGVVAQGHVQGQDVAVAVLPGEGKEVTVAVLGNPGRAPWTRTFLESLARE